MSIKLTLGQRIYYTGDMANEESAGTVIAINPPSSYKASNGRTIPLFCETCDIELDDGRVIKMLLHLAFEPGSGRRFWPLEEWLEQRAAVYAKFVSGAWKGGDA